MEISTVNKIRITRESIALLWLQLIHGIAAAAEAAEAAAEAAIGL